MTSHRARNRTRWVVYVIVGVVAVLLVVSAILALPHGGTREPPLTPATTGQNPPSSHPTPNPAAMRQVAPIEGATERVTYTVTTDSPLVMASYSSDAGGARQISGMSPLTVELTVHKPAIAYVLAQLNDQAGRVTCSITVDGTVMAKHTGTGSVVCAV